MIDLRSLCNISNIKKLSKDEVVVVEGSSNFDEMYILLTGVLGVYKNYKTPSQVQISDIAPGDMFGEMSMFAKQPSNSTIVALSESNLISINRNNFVEFCNKNPLIIFQIMETLCRKVLSANHETPKPVQPLVQSAVQPVAQAPKPVVATTTPPAPVPAPSVAVAAHVTSAPKPTTVTVTTSQPVKSLLFPENHGHYPMLEPEVYKNCVYEVKRECPCCGKETPVSITRDAKMRLAKPIGADCRKHMIDFDPIWYDVTTCQNCYFSTLTDYFSKPELFRDKGSKQALMEVKEKYFFNFAVKDMNRVFASYYVALLCAPNYTTQKQLTAKYWLQISWLYEDAKDDVMAKYATEMAYTHYQESYSSSNLKSAEADQMMNLILGTLASKLGKNNEAGKFFFNVKSNRNGSSAYIKLADDEINRLKEAKA